MDSIHYLKYGGHRVRATPLPAWAYFLELLAHCIMISAIDVALITGIGALSGMPLPTHWPAIALALVLGAASFRALGVAVASMIRNAEAGPRSCSSSCSRCYSSPAPTCPFTPPC